MKLYMKQKVFSWRGKTTVWDESGAERWFAAGEIFSWGRKIHLFDTSGNERAFIRQKLMTFLARYVIEIDGIARTLVKDFTFFTPRFRIENTDWSITGDFFAHEYQITSDGEPIVSISKKWLSWGDSYEIDIQNPADELFSLAVVIAIDAIKADNDNAAAASG